MEQVHLIHQSLRGLTARVGDRQLSDPALHAVLWVCVGRPQRPLNRDALISDQTERFLSQLELVLETMVPVRTHHLARAFNLTPEIEVFTV